MNEVWHPVVGYEGLYEVSNQGRVRSVERTYETRNKWNTFTRIKRSYVLKGKIDCYGYKTVRLSRGSRRDWAWRTVHSLVAEAFIGPRPRGQQVRHGPLGKAVNTPENLCYGTAQDNANDRVRDGNSGRGTANPKNKLSEKEVMEIYQHPQWRGSAVMLAKKYGVQPALISKIRKGQSWGWLTSPDANL